MPALAYSVSDFVAYQRIRASDINSKFTSIKTLLNTTGLDSTNIQTSGIATANLAAGCVTQAKRAALGQQLSSSCGTFSVSGGGETDITNLSCSITSTGRPVFIGLVPDGSANQSLMQLDCAAGTQATVSLRLYRDSTEIYDNYLEVLLASTGGAGPTVNYPPGSVWMIDTGASAAAYTYKITAARSAGTFNLQYCKLIVYEL